jgi:hypothetical protein
MHEHSREQKLDSDSHSSIEAEKFRVMDQCLDRRAVHQIDEDEAPKALSEIHTYMRAMPFWSGAKLFAIEGAPRRRMENA